MVMRDDNHFPLHDGRESIPVLGLKLPEILSPNESAFVIQAKEVVGLLGCPGHEDVFIVDGGCRRREAIELVMRVNLGIKRLLPQFFSCRRIYAQDELLTVGLVGAGCENLVFPQDGGGVSHSRQFD